MREGTVSPWQVLWDLTCLQTSERRDAWNTCEILHTLLEVPVQAPQDLLQIVLGKGSRLLPSERSWIVSYREAKATITCTCSCLHAGCHVFMWPNIQRKKRGGGELKEERRDWGSLGDDFFQAPMSHSYPTATGIPSKILVDHQETCCDSCL